MIKSQTIVRCQIESTSFRDCDNRIDNDNDPEKQRLEWEITLPTWLYLDPPTLSKIAQHIMESVIDFIHGSQTKSKP